MEPTVVTIAGMAPAGFAPGVVLLSCERNNPGEDRRAADSQTRFGDRFGFVVFEGNAQMTYVEENDKYVKVVKAIPEQEYVR